MSDTPEASLAARRLALRNQLRIQRQQIAAQLEPGAPGGYPRSVTMRLILQRTELVLALVSWLVSARFAGRARGLLFVVRALALFTAVVPALPGPAAAASPSDSVSFRAKRGTS